MINYWQILIDYPEKVSVLLRERESPGKLQINSISDFAIVFLSNISKTIDGIHFRRIVIRLSPLQNQAFQFYHYRSATSSSAPLSFYSATKRATTRCLQQDYFLIQIAHNCNGQHSHSLLLVHN